MKNQCSSLSKDFALLFARLAAGCVMLPHGAQKLLGWYGGKGFSATMDGFTEHGMSAVIAFLVIMGESLGSLGLITGFLTRFCGVSLVIIMCGAIPLHLKNGFFMNWFGQQAGEGFEYHILMIGLGLVLTILGPGRISLDYGVCRLLRKFSGSSDSDRGEI